MNLRYVLPASVMCGAPLVALAEEWDDPKRPEALGMRAEWFREAEVARAPAAASWEGDDSQFNPNAPASSDRGRAGAGKLSQDVIKDTVHGHLGEVKFCFTREQERHPELAGRVIVKFTIGESGAVSASEVESSTVDNANVERCVASAVRRWTFPAPKGGSMTVTYPFKVIALQ